MNQIQASNLKVVCEEACHTPSSPSAVAAPCKTAPDVSVHLLSSSAVGPDRDTE